MVVLVKLTVPWEDSMEVVFQREKEKYAELAAACSQAGWRPFTVPVQVGSRGYTGASAQRLKKNPGHQRCEAEMRPLRRRAGQLLAVALQEGQNVGEARILGWLQGAVGKKPSCCFTTQRCSGNNGVTHESMVTPRGRP